MRPAPAVAFALLCSFAGADAASACTMGAPTFDGELKYQRRLWNDADAVFLARATPLEGFHSKLNATIRVHGASPPRSSRVSVNTTCLETRPSGTVIAFARRIGRSDMPWRPWRWGEWVVIAHVYPNEVVDPVMVRALQETAARLERERG